MADKRRERHAHFADDVYLEREENSEKAHEEDELEFKKKQRRRSSVAKLPLGFAALRRVSTASGDCESRRHTSRLHSPRFVTLTLTLLVAIGRICVAW